MSNEHDFLGQNHRNSPEFNEMGGRAANDSKEIVKVPSNIKVAANTT